MNHMLIEVEPGRYVDLAQVLEFDDMPKEGRMLLLMPAPGIVNPKDDDGFRKPHTIELTGKARELALAYVAYECARTQETLAAMRFQNKYRVPPVTVADWVVAQAD